MLLLLVINLVGCKDDVKLDSTKFYDITLHLLLSVVIQVFEDVVEILDPEMNIDSETGDEEMQVKIQFAH